MDHQTIETIIVSIVFFVVIAFVMFICHLLGLAFCGESCCYFCRNSLHNSTNPDTQRVPDVLYVARGHSNTSTSQPSPEVVFI